ncbi:MAG: hypothetical protein ACE369_15465 [Roseovarius sp.]
MHNGHPAGPFTRKAACATLPEDVFICLRWEVRPISTSIVACLFLTGAAHAQTGSIYDQTCEELGNAVEQYYANREDGNLLAVIADDPASVVLDEFMAGLSNDAVVRVRLTINSDFIAGCVRQQVTGPDIPETVGGHLELITRNMGLDRTAPNWGMPKIPELDFEIHTAEDWVRAHESFQKEEPWRPYNDYLHVAFAEYLERFDIETIEELKTYYGLRNSIINEFTEEELQQPLAIGLTRLAKKRGLRLK